MNVGVYIQVPFCQTKCTYCNFHTGVFSSSIYASYVDAVCSELVARSQQLSATVDTVYVGGGTPSLLDPAHLLRIIKTLRANFPCAIEEATLEADPETITAAKAGAWREAGLERISLGAQSFNDAELRATGRMHRREDIPRAVQILRAARFSNLTLDLIAGLPHQTESSWNNSLREVLALQPEHISIYMLEIDEGSRLGREVLTGGKRYSATNLPSDDEIAAFYETACERLAAVGYEHYEISNWGLPGFRSRHNLKYWRRAPYLGLGAGAHSFDGRRRWANPHDPAAYVAALRQGQLPCEQEEIIRPQQALAEELFLGLRLLEGIDLARIEREYGVVLRERMAPLLEQGLLEECGSRVRLATSKLTVSNEVFVALLDEEAEAGLTCRSTLAK